MFKLLKWAGFIIFLAGTGAAALGFHFWVFLNRPGSPQLMEQVVTIAPGSSFKQIVAKLHDAGLVSNPELFRVLCRLKHAGPRLQAGEYRVSTLVTPEQLLSKLTRGEVALHRITLPEGSTVRDVARILAAAQIASADEVLRLAHDKTFVQSLGLHTSSLEGYLFPETYYFKKPTSAVIILKEMVHQFQSRAIPTWEQRAKEMGMSLHDVVTLASIVEKEAKMDKERPIIAAVFLNRLKIGMPLQSDPTTVYDLPGFSGRITPQDLKRPSPYNTYLNKGLPPGPICNPGQPSIEAVLYPDDVPYLYFVSNNDGTHRFSKNYSEHRKAIKQLRKKHKDGSGKP